jgi:hypothetical protein
MDTKRCRRTFLLTLTGVLCALVVLAFATAPAMAQASATPKPSVGPRPAACNDGDGDGFGSPGNGDCSNGSEQDCDDSNGDIYPGATETCNAVDDDCDGNVDEGFLLSKESPDSGDYDCQDGIDNDNDGKTDQLDPQCVAAFCAVGDPAGCHTGDPGGCCLTGASTVCKQDGSGTECVILPDHFQHFQQPEPLVSASEDACFDGEDNDCDGLTDHQELNCQTSEKCDGFDNDDNGQIDDGAAFANLGTACTAGTGVCQTNGVFVCSDDKLGLKCTAVAGLPGTEGPAGNGRCSDGKDNDCDGTTDLADSNCQGPEVCDGLDNDGNDGADEDFTDLGEACSAGLGACATDGVKVCKADGSGTVCNAVAGSKSIEGPSGPTCTDGVDNDCDGQIDDLDLVSCGSANLAVECSLRYVNGRPGDDCTGWHVINYDALNGSDNTVVKAELLAIGLDGLVINAREVHAGDQAQMASRVDPVDYKFQTISSAKGTKHTVFAPVPMLRVTATDGPITATAYCSNVPYLDVIQPAGEVVSASTSSVTPVFVALPRVDPTSLLIQVDGVDIAAGLGLDPATDFPGGKYAGDVLIGGVSVHITELLVGSAPIASLGSNTLSFNLDGLGCGTHIITVSGDPQAGARPSPLSAQCDADDLTDTATSIVFTIDVTNPVSGQVTSAVPTPVDGTVCHGAHIADVRVNGKFIDPVGQVHTPGDGVTSGDKYEFTFHTDMAQTDLGGEVDGTNTDAYTFDPGANLLYASAADDEGNSVYDSFTFAVGEVSQPGSLAPSAQNELAALVDSAAREALLSHIKPATGNIVPKAFAMGMSKQALDTFFTETCKNANEDTKAQILAKLVGKKFPGKEVEVDAACNPTASTTIKDVTFNGDFTCGVELSDGLITMTANVPEMLIKTNTYGYCCDGCDFICWSEVIVDIDIDFTVPKPGAQGIRFVFPVDETTMLNGGEITGQFIKPAEIGDAVVTDNRTEVNCFSAVANFFIALGKAIIDGLVFVFTFGQVDPPFDLTPSFDDVATSEDLAGQLQIEEFPVAMKGIKPDPGAVAATDKLLVTNPTGVEIDANGVTIELEGQFSSTFTDPDTLSNPGAVKEPAPTPHPPQAGAGNTYFVASDDIVNQLFAAMQAQGEFNTVCKPSGKTVGDFLAPDCLALDTPKKRGVCQGEKHVDCGTLTEATLLDQAVARGSCFGATHEHSFCATLGTGNGQTFCNLQPYLNIFADQKFLFCGQMNVPPRLLLHDNAATAGQIESDLRFNDFLVGIVLDRNLDDTVADLKTTGVCLGTGAVIDTDCKFMAVCTDFDLHANWTLTNDAGKLKIKPTMAGKQDVDRPAGATCAGGTPTTKPPTDTGEDVIDGPQVSDAADQAEDNVPPFQTDGLDLNGIVEFSNPRLIAIETDGNLKFQDFFGITGDMVAP